MIRRLRGPHVPALTIAAALSFTAAPAAAQAPLVDCSKPEFQRPNSARSLYLWTDGAEERIARAKKQGLFGVKHSAMKGDAVSLKACAEWISKRGTAHCKEPGNATYREGLARLIKLCRPDAPTKGGPVNCADPRFKHAEAGVDLLLRWVEFALSALKGLRPNEEFRVKPKCDDAHKHAGTAYCKAPKDPRTLAAMDKVRKACAAAKARFTTAKAEAKASEAEAKAAAKANRKIVPMPRSTYRGGDAGALRRMMKKALLAARVAKAPSEVLKVQPMGRWQRGRYTDTKVPYQKITGIVLWWDKDKDGVCRFVSYKFIKDRTRGRWSPLRFKAFCMGCPEGWVACK